MDRKDKLKTICAWINEDTFGSRDFIAIIKAIAGILGQDFPISFIGSDSNVTDSLFHLLTKWDNAISDREIVSDEIMRQLETYGRCIAIEEVELSNDWRRSIKVNSYRLENGGMRVDLDIDFDDLRRCIRLVDTNHVEWHIHGNQWFPSVRKE